MKTIERRDQTLFANVQTPKYVCRNCKNKLRERVLRDFAQIMPDNRLTCPLCMSLDIREVDTC